MTLRFAAALTACAVLLSAAPGSRYAGRWELLRAESDNIDKAIEAAIAPMSFLIRPIARTKLKRRNVAFPSMRITGTAGDALRIQQEQGLDVAYPAVGVPVKTRAPDASDVLTRLLRADAEELLLSYEADLGRREDRYQLSADGSRLRVLVRITSDRLPKPLTYQLVYRRSP